MNTSNNPTNARADFIIWLQNELNSARQHLRDIAKPNEILGKDKATSDKIMELSERNTSLSSNVRSMYEQYLGRSLSDTEWNKLKDSNRLVR